MNEAIPAQHPAVVLRSHYRHLRTLLAIATIAIVGLTIAVVILAMTTSTGTVIPSRATAATSTALPTGIRYDGGPEEGTRGPAAAQPSATIRYDGGPEEGTRGPGH
jgi:hypothetical protein